MQCLLIGNFGVGNLGDEALKEYFITAYPTVSWAVLSAHPEAGELPRLPGGIRSFFRFNWLKTLQAYRRCDAVVFGGGSLLTDTESVHACIIWWLHTVPAKLFRKPIHFAFQGVGPFRTPVGQWFSGLALRSATSISVRDEASFKRAKSLTKSTKIVQTCDPVIWLIEKEKIDVRTKNILVLIPRKNSSEKFTKTAQEVLESRSWDEVRVISMEPQNVTEQTFVKTLVTTLGHSTKVVEVATLHDLLLNIADAGAVVSERYHGALPAKMYKKPLYIVSQAEGDKLSTLDQTLPDVALVEKAQNELKVYIH